jgi:hypothetical protein
MSPLAGWIASLQYASAARSQSEYRMPGISIGALTTGEISHPSAARATRAKSSAFMTTS